MVCLERREQHRSASHSPYQKKDGAPFAVFVHGRKAEEPTSAGIASSCHRSKRRVATRVLSGRAHENPPSTKLPVSRVITMPCLASSHAESLSDAVCPPSWSTDGVKVPVPSQTLSLASGLLPASGLNSQEQPFYSAAANDISRRTGLDEGRLHSSTFHTQVVTGLDWSMNRQSDTLWVPVDMHRASKKTDEKRARNARASARFRARRKDDQETSQRTIADLQRQVHKLIQERDDYRSLLPQPL